MLLIILQVDEDRAGRVTEQVGALHTHREMQGKLWERKSMVMRWLEGISQFVKTFHIG